MATRPCPICNGSFVPGYVEVSDRWIDLFAWGLSYLILRFEGSEPTNQVDLARPGERKEALGCPVCRTVVVKTTPWLP